MFEDALLESSPQVPVLRRFHYVLSAFTGTVVFALGLAVMPLLSAALAGRALLIASAIVGVAGSLYALMLCYVAADSRQQQLNSWPWVGLTLALNLPGFLLYLIYSARRTGDWRRAAIPLAYVTEALLIGVLILVPLIYTQALPRQLLVSEIHIPPPPGPPPAQPPGRPAPSRIRHAINPFLEPPIIPNHIVQVVEPPEPPSMSVGDPVPFVPGAPYAPGAGGGYTMGGAPWAGNVPPPPPAPRIKPSQKPLRIGGDVIAAKALYQPSPIYPPLATMARIQGTVVLEAVIGKDGRVQELKVLSGHPMLVRAALDAVKTWRYQPTLLNTEPVDVLTEIEVRFNLSE